MLDVETKRRIDMARDILVGKIPDPKSQVEQITIALVYKFMDDMDEDSRELGGKATFFKGEFQRYSWHKMFDPKLSGFELVSAYGESIQKMNQNPNIPQLFRDIFKNAYLPYRDPETLKSFLKVIGEFEYDHSERLGDAFEYLLSVLGSQGEAGQFRTPRHIIDFMVEIIDPKKTESVLDPACGTAGFLISSYKHILKHNSNNFDPEKDEKAFEFHNVRLEEITINNKQYKGDKLSSDDRERLVQNIRGYDISPDMVRLSLVNMYLHGFKNPKISEYDTLTSEDKWSEYADTILANPPFMSPKGGIKPHKRFSVESKRSEVLFLDYIAEHLTPQGKSCVIVPEGIIFQTQKAYIKLRKMLVEKNYLIGVISLPAGVFNPYSGVKTSILWLDRKFAKKTNKILFAKIENDGFGLGAQRNPINKNDLPDIFCAIKGYKKALEAGSSFNCRNQKNIFLIEKKNIGQDGNYIFSAEHYKPTQTFLNNQYPIVAIGEVATFKRGPFGSSIKKSVCVPKGKGTYKVYEQGNIIKNDFKRGEYYISETKFRELEKFELLSGDIVITCAGTLGRIAIVPGGIEKGVINSVLMRVRVDESKILREYFVLLFSSPEIQDRIIDKSTGVAVKNMFATSELKKFVIPLPSLVMQKKIVSEIEEENKRISSCMQSIEKHRQQIKDRIAKVWGDK